MKFIEDIMEDNSQHVRCYICKHYLSVKPILVDVQTGESICGRCEASSNLVVNNHWYERFARQFCFPCKYLAEGCTIRKLFEDIGIHEKSCFYYSLKCFCSWTGNPIVLINHYEKNHKELVIKDGDVVAPKENFTRFLFKDHYLNFFVNCKRRSNKFSVEVIALAPVFNKCKAIFTCKLLYLDLKLRLEMNNIIKLPHTEMLPTFTLNCEISEKYIDSILKRIVCPRCSILMTPPILVCPQGHITCIECLRTCFQWCRICDIECEFSCDPELECIAAALTLPCRWNCGSKLNAFELGEHEWSCEKRLYKCRRDFRCNWQGFLTELMTHENICFEDGTDHLLILDAMEVSFLDISKDYSEFQLLTCNYYFFISCYHNETSTRIYLYSEDSHALGRFRFEADLIHIEDPNFIFNKTYKLRHSHRGFYTVTIEEEDTVPFGNGKPCKITVRLILLNEEERRIKTDTIYKKCFKNYRRLV